MERKNSVGKAITRVKKKKVKINGESEQKCLTLELMDVILVIDKQGESQKNKMEECL